MTPERAGSRDRILMLLKTKGPQSTTRLAERLKLTPMGVRQHLGLLAERGLVDHAEEPRGVGRPARVWSLTDEARGQFPEGYADLTVDMLGALRETFGANGIKQLIRTRTKRQIEDYRQRMPPTSAPLSSRVSSLAKIRSEEGYMAECRKNRDGSLTLTENHCPICAAAEICQGLCDGELELFKKALGKGVSIERTEHMLEGARRCAYRIAPA